MVSKIVITHVAKSKCRLSIWTRVVWFKDPKFSKGTSEGAVSTQFFFLTLFFASIFGCFAGNVGWGCSSGLWTRFLADPSFTGVCWSGLILAIPIFGCLPGAAACSLRVFVSPGSLRITTAA